MKKRFFLALISFGVPILAVLLVWQPDAAKKYVLNTIAKDVSRSTAYDVAIGRVTGNIFTGFSLLDVHVVAKADRSELLYSKMIKIGVDWWALIHKKFRITRLDWVEPVLKIDWPLSPKGKSEPQKPFSFAYSIRKMTIEDGKVVLRNASLSPAKELSIYNIALSAHLGIHHLRIDQLDMALEKGQANLKGLLTLQRQLSGELTLEDSGLPLDRILAFTGVTSPIPLPHSGNWKIQMSSGSATVDMNGRLAQGPIALHLFGTPEGIQDVRGKWMKPGFVSASVHLIKGVGPFQIAVSSGAMKGKIEGEANVPASSIRGHGAMAAVVWTGKRMEKMDVSFSITPRHQKATIGVTNLYFDMKIEKPYDIQTAQVTLEGRSPHWMTTAVVHLRNGTSAEESGRLARGDGFWRLQWDHLVLQLPTSDTWTTAGPGSITWGPHELAQIRNFTLTNGAQSFEITNAQLGGGDMDVALVARQIDPSPWAKLLNPDLIFSKGALNASLQVSGKHLRSNAEGYINGKVETLEYKPLGLRLQTIEFDVQSTGNQWSIKRFTAKTKKGQIEASGGSLWPALDYTFRGHELAIRASHGVQGTGEFDIHLGGTAQAPLITGRLGLKEAVYTAPKEKQKKTAETAPQKVTSDLSLWRRTAIDIAAQWSRNVWYRDGVTSIETQADVRIQKAKDKADLLLTGSVRSIRGSYNYFGRDFNLESGQIQFTGTPEINPNLNVEATYRSDPTIVYLDISGTLQKPVLALRSNPPLPEKDIISVIVFGQPLNELRSKSNGQSSNQEMMQAVGGVLGSYVTKQLRQTGISELNFDVMNLQSTPQGSQLTLGRYLTRRLFISYGQAVRGSAEKSITADYFLTDKWTLQGASDSTQGNYMDFLFRYPLSKGAPNTSPMPTSPFRKTLDQPTLQPGFAQ